MKKSDSSPLLSEQAYSLIKRQILEGVLKPGSVLSERTLSVETQLSLAPVRRALHRLADEGFLNVSPRRGAVVAVLSVDNVLDIFKVRMLLETHAVRQISGRLDQHQKDALNRNMEQQWKAQKQGKMREFHRIDMDFHALLCEYAGNEEVKRVMQHFQDKIYQFVVAVSELKPERLYDSALEHEKIVEALVKGDRRMAALAMQRHLSFGTRHLEKKRHQHFETI